MYETTTKKRFRVRLAHTYTTTEYGFIDVEAEDADTAMEIGESEAQSDKDSATWERENRSFETEATGDVHEMLPTGLYVAESGWGEFWSTTEWFAERGSARIYSEDNTKGGKPHPDADWVPIEFYAEEQVTWNGVTAYVTHVCDGNVTLEYRFSNKTTTVSAAELWRQN